MTTTELSRFCSVCARHAGLDAAGTAYAYNHVLAVEIPLPWPASMYSEPGVQPQELLDLRQIIVDSYQRGEPMLISAFAIAPDPAYSVAGFRRVISYRRPEGPFAQFEQTEYLVPEAHVGPLSWALLVAPDQLPAFEEFLLPRANTRDLLICTHGSVDAACAKFGFPIYRQLRRLADETDGQLRVWRVSHFGGHVFAPTLLDMPEFRYWAYIDQEEAELLAFHTGDPARLRRCYRGWAGFENSLLQAAERELFVRYGWEWLAFVKAGRVLAESAPGELPAWAEVRIDFVSAEESGTFEALVEVDSQVECVPSSGGTEAYKYPQYAVKRIKRVVDIH